MIGRREENFLSPSHSLLAKKKIFFSIFLFFFFIINFVYVNICATIKKATGQRRKTYNALSLDNAHRFTFFSIYTRASTDFNHEPMNKQEREKKTEER